MKKLLSFFTKRSTRYGSNFIIYVIIVLAILVFINYLSLKHYKRWDVTKNKKYSISEQTIKVIKGLNAEISLKAFYRRGDELEKRFKDLLNEYNYQAPVIKYEFIDPDRNPAITQNYGVTTFGTSILEYKQKTEKITRSTEEALTNALLKITSSEVKKVYFLEGHGEPDIDSDDKNGYSIVKQGLNNQTLETDKILLMRVKEIPLDCTVMVIAGPQKELFDHEKEALSAYLKSGGSALFMLDPAPFISLAEFLQDWGIKVGEDMIVDVNPLSKLFGMDYFTPIISKYPLHPITKEFKLPSFFPVARSISRAKTKPGVNVIELALTSPNSWGETNIKDNKAEFNENEDNKGPLSLAVVVTSLAENDSGQEPDPQSLDQENKFQDETRIAVVGDSDFAKNQFISLSGNKDFLLNIISWLAGEEKLISIRPKDPQMNLINLSGHKARIVFWLSMALYPLVLLAGAGVVWWRRRK
ncbi:MAG: Gldg family protein [Candidatus Omnitrophica bacterium]|nr:Gldg family protein [Candidatus Omnitrophota bacterium]